MREEVKILLLIMSCNKEFFINAENVIRNTYLTNINKYDNIEYFFFTAGENERIDSDNHKIYVNSGDDWSDTYLKNKRVFEMITEAGIEYDYIVRVNTSVYLNLELVSNLCQYLYNIKSTNIYCGEINRYENANYPVGKCIIFNKDHINQIINTDIEVSRDPDDFQFSKVFKNDNIYKLIKCAYYNYYPNHYLNCSALNLDFIKNNIFISYKSLEKDRTVEYKEAYEIHNSLKDYQYDPHDLIESLQQVVCHIFDHSSNKFVK